MATEKLRTALLNTCEGYDKQFRIKSTANPNLFVLQRKAPGFCYICKRVHDKGDSYISSKDGEFYIGCYQNPKNRAAVEENILETLTKTKIGCISAPIGMGKRTAIINFVRSLPPNAKILILSTRFLSSDQIRAGFKHCKEEDQYRLYKFKRLILQMDSLHKISEEYCIIGEVQTYDYIILDEFASLCRKFFSSTMDNHRYIAARCFERLIRDTPNVIVMGASLKQKHIALIREFKPMEDFNWVSYVSPNPVIRECYRLKGTPQEIISKILSMAREGLKIYVPSYSKEFVKNLCQAFKVNNMGNIIQDCTDGIWKKAQVVAIGEVGVEINLPERYFDTTFAIVGRTSQIEEQFVSIHKVKNTNQNTLYLWVDNPGKADKEVPSEKQIRLKLEKRYRNGTEKSPVMLTMPFWLKNLYVTELQNVYRAKRRLNEEVEKSLAKHHYVTKEISTPEEQDINMNKVPSEAIEPLREMWKNKTMRTILCNASTEVKGVCSDELSQTKYKVITMLNKALGLEFSFHGNSTIIERDDFIARVKPILENKGVQELYKFSPLRNKKQYAKIVNKIYKDWTGKNKVVYERDATKRKGCSVIPYILQETTIGEDNIPIRNYVFP